MKRGTPAPLPSPVHRGEECRSSRLPLKKGRPWLFQHTPVNATTGDKALLRFCPVCPGSVPCAGQADTGFPYSASSITLLACPPDPTSRMMPATLRTANNSWLSPKRHRPLERQPSQSSPVYLQVLFKDFTWPDPVYFSLACLVQGGLTLLLHLQLSGSFLRAAGTCIAAQSR